LSIFPQELQNHVLALLKRCSLFEEEEAEAARDELPSSTNMFKPIVLLDDIGAVILNGFCNKLRDAMREPPVRINKPDGIRTSSNWIVENFYRCDFLVQHNISDELGNELVDVALAILQLSHTDVLDFVVSCTSPTYGFVNRICDGLRDTGYDCGRHVFRRRSSIRSELRNLKIGKGTKVLLFTDLISSGDLVGQMCQALEENGAKVVGLIALVDARTTEEMGAYSTENRDPFERFNAGTAVSLTTIEIPKRDSKDRKYGFYIDPETLAVKPARRDLKEQWDHYFAEVFSGKGGIISSGTFSSPVTLMVRLSECGALTYGHFIQGRNHSTVLCDARKVFNDELLRNEIVTNIAKYILKHNISLVVSPNHSNVYLLTQALQYRFKLAEEEGGDRHLDFATALRVQSRGGENDYQLAIEADDISPNLGAHNAVMILDDGVCSGTTIKALVREVVAAFQNHKLPTPSIHVVAFVSRLSENDASFWDAIARQAGGMLNFTYFMALPLPVYLKEHCPVCSQQAEVSRLLRNSPASDYVSLFCRNWSETLVPVDLYTVPSSQRTEVLSGEAVHTLAAYFIALRRGNVKLVWQKIMEYQNATVVITALGHLLLRSYDINAREPSPLQVIKEMLRFAKMKERTLGERLYILRKLIQFTKLSTSPNPITALVADLVDAYVPALENQTILGGLEVLFFQLLFGEGGFKEAQNSISGNTPTRYAQLNQQILDALESTVRKNNDPVIRLSITWLIHSLSGRIMELKSVGAVVLRLASLNRFVPHHHSQRFALQEATTFVQHLIATQDIADQQKRLETLCRGVRQLFTEMYDCIEILTPQSDDLIEPYRYLQEQKQELGHLDDNLSTLRKCTDANQIRTALDGLYDALERLRTAWFAEPIDRVKIFLRPFSVQPTTAIREITHAYLGKATIETSGLDGRLRTLVLFPPEEFATLVRHLYAHLNDPKKVIPGQSVHAHWQQLPHAIEKSKVVLTLHNTGSRGNSSPTLRGLRGFQESLRQYGGELDLRIEEGDNGFICTVKITLHIWE
jgi:orotate phosphoribosyltransferase